MAQPKPDYGPEAAAAATALRAGRIAEAEGLVDAALSAAPDDADLHNLKSAALTLRGAHAEALAPARRAAELRPNDTRIALNLGAALVNARRLEEALEIFDQALAEDPSDLRARHSRGRLLTELDRAEAALADLERTVAAAPRVAELRVSLAEALLGAARPKEARAALEIAAEMGDASARRSAALGRAAADLGDFAAARTAFEAAIAADPKPLHPYVALVETERRLGDPERVAAAVSRALGHTPVARREAGRPEARVMVLEHFSRNDFASFRPTLNSHSRSNFIGEAPPGRIGFLHVFANQPASVAAARDLIGECAILFNNWATPETARRADDSGMRALLAAAPAKTPIVNRPDAVAECDRAANAAAYADAKGFVFPTTLFLPKAESEGAFASADRAALGEARRAAVLDAMRPPLILRPTSSHKGGGARVVASEAALGPALAALPDADLYAIAYHDCGAADGVFRRYRVSVIDGELRPQNMHVASQWNVHGHERDIYDWSGLGLDREEIAFVEAPEQLLGRRPEEVFAPILARTRLDVYGVDFGIRRSDGAVVVFEVNAAMLFTSEEITRRYPHLKPVRARLVADVEALLLRRAGLAA